jgi:hypothetical protein
MFSGSVFYTRIEKAKVKDAFLQLCFQRPYKEINEGNN